MNGRLDEARDTLRAERQRRADEAQRSPLNLFDHEARRIAERETERREQEQAIASAASHVSNEWKAKALDAARRCAEKLDAFTVLDVRAEMGDDDQLEPYDARAYGGIMRELAKRGWARTTGDYRTGPPSTHSRPLRVWRSLIRRGGPNAA